jgi:hypothetical protein
MKLGIMQPYFFPYIGYFQLMNAVDEFIIYDNIEFTKKGWINRNRILVNGNDSFISIPIKKDSDYLDIRNRSLAEIWSLEKKKILNRIIASYKKAPIFESVYPIIEKCFFFEEDNLFKFIYNSLTILKEYLEIKTPFLISSTISIDHALKADKKVVAICKARKADLYLNPIGGIELYRRDDFKDEGIDLYFLKSDEVRYKQFNNEFVPWLSMIDVMMFNSKEEIMKMLAQYSLR